MKKFTKEKGKILCFVIIVVVVVGAGFYHYKKVERKYQACRDKCWAESEEKTGLKTGSLRLFASPQFKACTAGCREKYGR